ncbi:hypothetical protein FOMPIDRAFT_1024742 [Fomitopsis schrenkii]|uniref:NADH:flavin oxidoreductase/NADH oxidase N-terminal domain-containing protein n=1 Tax=Fomitopsis schrenkii TaxID=2126942 RepID=S8E042_FOMSC|nr:hypothetical protein FOMPIDRAFT_1024742 [Fomitopsis schrenkii]
MRFRADDQHVPSVHAAEYYYAQRVTVSGTLLITEGTSPSANAGGLKFVPGIWSDAQVEAWSTDAVRERRSCIFCQLWALGRAGADIDPAFLEEDLFQCVSASDVKLSTSIHIPRPLKVEEINDFLATYGTAALNALRAGLDGIELHAGIGYLIDQFLQDVSNRRTDAYDGTIRNRARFALEVVRVARVAAAVGANKTESLERRVDMGMGNIRGRRSRIWCRNSQPGLNTQT